MTHANLIDTRTGQVLPDHTIVIEDSRIIAILPANAAYVAERVVDAKGAFVIPGLWDSHVHLLQNDGAIAVNTAPKLLGYGITHVRDMGSSLAALRAFKAEAASTDLPTVIASGPAFWTFELPYGDKSQQQVVTDPQAIEAAVRETAMAGADFIKAYAGFQPDHLAVLVAAAQRQGLRVAGHAQPGASVDVQASMGLVTIEHLDTSIFEGCDVDHDAYFERIIAARFRNSGETLPGIMTAFVGDVDRNACSAIFGRATDEGLAITPTLAASFLPPSEAKRLLAELPPARREGCEIELAAFDHADPNSDAAFAAARNALMKIILESGVTILAGSDAPGSCNTLGPALALELSLLNQSGMSPLEVLQSATLNPARVFGSESRPGAIEIGTEADFVLLNDNPLIDVTAYANPSGLFARGRWRSEDELSRLRTFIPAP